MTKKLKQIRKRKIRIEIEYLPRLVKGVRAPYYVHVSCV